jgi:hypothetical protein
VDAQIQIFLTSALAGGEWSASGPGRFTPGEVAPGIHWRGGWAWRRGKEKILDPTRTQLLPLGRPARSQSLYGLRYPGSCCYYYFFFVRPKLEYASVAWNSVTINDSNKLERIQKRFAAL